MTVLAAVVMWQLEVTDPSPLDPRLHGPHNHALGTFSSKAECVRRGRQEVKIMNTSKGFKKDAKYRCYITREDE
jgi:hypothetical protein